MLLLLSLIAAANAIGGVCVCISAPFHTAVLSGSSTVTWVLGTPDASSKTTQMTKDMQTVTTFDLLNPVFVNKVAPGVRITKTKLRVGFAGTWDDCGFATAPFAFGERAFFALQKSDLDLVDRTVTTTSSVVTNALPPADALQSGPLCYPTELADSLFPAGRCISTTSCSALNVGGASGFKSYPFAQTDSERPNCKAFAANVQCCAFGGGTAVVDISLPTLVDGDVDYEISACGETFLKPCTSQSATNSRGSCLSKAASNAIADRAAVLGLTDNDVTGLSTFKCATTCANGGKCRDNKCVCDAYWTGATCTTRVVPPKMKISLIAPGGTGSDVWLFGSLRNVTFHVDNYDPSFDVKSLEVNIIDRDEYSGCSIANGPLSAYRESILMKDISELVAGGKKSFDVVIPKVLGGLSCVEEGSSFAIEIIGRTVDGGVSADLPRVVGRDFTTKYAGCAVNGFVGRCQVKSGCAATAGWAPYDKFTSGANPCGLAGQINDNTCCVPDHSPVATGKRFAFKAPAANSDAPVVAGSLLPVAWEFDATKASSSWSCSISAGDKFTLELVKKTTSWVVFKDYLVVKSYGEQTLASGGVKAPITLDVGSVKDDGTYYLQAKFSVGCLFQSRTFAIVAPGCAAGRTLTTVGECIPSRDCTLSTKTPGLCAGIVGTDVTCCNKPRSGMSLSFRDDDAETLENVAAAPTAVAALLVTLVAAALL